MKIRKDWWVALVEEILQSPILEDDLILDLNQMEMEGGTLLIPDMTEEYEFLFGISMISHVISKIAKRDIADLSLRKAYSLTRIHEGLLTFFWSCIRFRFPKAERLRIGILDGKVAIASLPEKEEEETEKEDLLRKLADVLTIKI